MSRNVKQNRDPSVPAVALVVTSIVSTQIGATIAIRLFRSAGAGGAAFLRLGFAAVLVCAFVRPNLQGLNRSTAVVPILFGLTLAGMNFSFYCGLTRVHLGIAVALEFIGPLGVAVAGSRTVRDAAWIVLAALGIVLLSPWGGLSIDPFGILLVLLAGALWACYILLSRRVGAMFPDAAGLAIALIVAAIVLVPVGIVSAGASLLSPRVLLTGLAVAVLSSVITYSFELRALRTLRAATFGVLMSLEPAVAAVLALVFLGQALSGRVAAAIACIVVASAGASWFSRETIPAPVG